MKVNDNVSVIDDDVRGKIIAVADDLVTIEDEFGFHYTYPKNQLVPFLPDLYQKSPAIYKNETQKTVSKKHQKAPQKIDLHFENLVKNPKNFDSFERLLIQKEKLMEKLEYCRANNLKKLIVIHGIGDGVLQQMVHDVLESQTGLEFHNHDILHHQSGSVLVIFQ